MRARIIFRRRGFAHPNVLPNPLPPDSCVTDALRRDPGVLPRASMKLMLAGSGLVMMLAAMSVGCSPSVSAKPKSADVFTAMDDELSRTIGTTTLTSATFEALPDSRGSLSAAREEDEPLAPAVQTWGGTATEPVNPQSH